MFRLRFFFDLGSAVCFWAGNDVTQAKFSYTIEAHAVPLRFTLCQQAEYLCIWYDTSIDWNNLGGEPLWSLEETALFKKAVKDFLIKVREELFPDFEVINEFRLLRANE